MGTDVEPLAVLSRSTATAMLGHLHKVHQSSGRPLELSLQMSMPELQEISRRAKAEMLRKLFAVAKAGREAGGVGAQRGFERALSQIDTIAQAWDGAVGSVFDQQIRAWVDSGESVLGPPGWVRVRVTEYQRASVWWTDTEGAATWCRTAARDVFTCITADPRSLARDTARLAELSEPSIGPAIDTSVMAILGDFQDQQRYDAARYGVHPQQAQDAADRIHAMRGPLTGICRSELSRLLREWDA